MRGLALFVFALHPLAPPEKWSGRWESKIPLGNRYFLRIMALQTRTNAACDFRVNGIVIPANAVIGSGYASLAAAALRLGYLLQAISAFYCSGTIFCNYHPYTILCDYLL